MVNIPLLRRRRLGFLQDLYAVLGFSAPLVADFEEEYYRKAGAVSTFNDTFTHSRLGNATMVDSDGLIKWAPHNLVPYSDEVGNASSTWVETNVIATGKTVTATNASGTHRIDPPTLSAVSGRITVELRIKPNGYTYFGIREQSTTGAEAVFYLSGAGSVPYSTAGTGSDLNTSIVFDGEYYDISLSVSLSSTTSLRLYVLDANPASNLNSYSWSGDDSSGVIIDKANVYRSDLGGMVNNPDRGDSYVPTTDAAIHQARRNHYTWNGTSWVNSGLLLETEARTNLIQYSEDFSNAQWTTTQAGLDSITASSETTPDGLTSAYEITEDNTTGVHYFEDTFAGLDTVTYTLSVFAKQGIGTRYLQLRTGGAGVYANFNLSTGTVVDSGGSYINNADIQPYGDWYRCYVTGTFLVAPASYQIIISNGTGAAPSYAGDGASSIIVYGAQLEAGATPSSYMPNYGLAAGATKPTESLQIAAADMPWPTPNVIGAELVAGGDFNDAADLAEWTPETATLSLENDELKSVSSGGGQGASQQLSLTVGKLYQATADIRTVSGISASLTILNAAKTAFVAQSQSVTSSTFTQVSIVWVCTQAGEHVYFRNAAAGTAYADNISVREIDPLSVSLQMQGKMTYADIDDYKPYFHRWYADSNTYIQAALNTTSTSTGNPRFFQNDASYTVVQLGSNDAYSPDILVPYNIASRHGSTFINGAVDGTADTEDTTPVALPDLSATNFSLGYDYMGTIGLFRAWNKDIGDAGIEDATS